MKKIITIILLCWSVLVCGQDVFSGMIIDGESGEVLPYVNVGVVGKNVGTVTDINGVFSLEIDAKYDADTLMMSMIGYEDLVFMVRDFKSGVGDDSIFKITSITTDLQEIVISGSQLKSKILGNKTKSKNIRGHFVTDELGNEVGIIIKIKKSPTYIDKFHASIVENKYGLLKFRLNFYSVKDKMPHENILKENIFVETQIKEGVLTVDLSAYNIVVEDDFMVSLEWIEDLGEDGLYFSMSFFGSPVISRKTSQAYWKKQKPVGIGFSVTAKY